MQEIFARYCTPKERPYGRQGTFSWRNNDEETINIIEVVNETSKRCAVTVEQVVQKTDIDKQHTFYSRKFRYILLKKGGKWLIDNRKLHCPTGEWIKYYL